MLWDVDGNKLQDHNLINLSNKNKNGIALRFASLEFSLHLLLSSQFWS